MCHGLSPSSVCSQREGKKYTDNQGVSKESVTDVVVFSSPPFFCTAFWFILDFTGNLVAHCAIV